MDSSEFEFAPVEGAWGALDLVVADALAAEGWCVTDQLLDPLLITELYEEVLGRDDLMAAKVGRHHQQRAQDDVRRDKTGWLQGESPAQARYIERMESLRMLMNRRLFLGLQEYEAHFARFDSGDFYRTHVDALKGQRNRMVTCVTYLNPHWRPEWGGQLVLYDGQGAELTRVQPKGGVSVLFLSEEFPHQVLPARTSRYSIAGWFRVR
ncbi:2OG-Fe(II) oxygenase [Ketobacter sp.]|uniref:2OG-Fe(II) oxygenase n=1 Tax=Ketobacter sp. TaxID=2083498 RepID=UPI000F2BDEC4|nr:2OG-Fe(II) oxygenase [Ketobacter sp.]RLT96845.1 MAG: hypothetical protein D9N14_12490 [Ketobacter sp.]